MAHVLDISNPSGEDSTRQTLFASAARTASVNGAAVATADVNNAFVTLNVTAVSGTAPTLDVKIQGTDDGGTIWFDIPNAVFTQKVATGSQAIQINTFSDVIRAVATIGGTTPSFTFAVKAVLK